MDMDDPLFTAPVLVQALVGGLAASAIGTALTPKPSVPSIQAPTVTAPTPMPTAGDASMQAAKKASIADQLARQGRASTILTDPLNQDSAGTKLGG